MKNRKLVLQAVLFTLGVALVATGCAHNAHTRGSVIVKHSDTEGDVCMGSNEVNTGDRMALYRHDCKQRMPDVGNGERGGPRSVTSCQKIKVGEGEIIQLLGEHYSTLKTDQGVKLSEGLSVEKL